MIADTSFGAMAAILVMTGVSLLLRWGGFYIMAHITPGPRLEAAFRSLPGAVAAALFAPLVLADGVSALAAILVAAIIARRGLSDTLALALAIGAAVLIRQAGF